MCNPRGVLDDLLVKVGPFIFPSDFVIVDMEDMHLPLPLIDVEAGELIIRF